MLARVLRHPITLIVAIALAAHGLLLLNDGLYYDSWMLDTHVRNGRYDVILGWLNDHSRPFTGLYYIITGYFFTPPFWHKLSVFTYLLINSFIVFDIARQMHLNTQQATLISVLSLTYPTYQAYVEHGANSQISNLNQFLVGAWFVLCVYARSVLSKKIYLLLGSGFFFVSFSTESLFAYYLGFLVLVFVQQYQRNHGSIFENSIWLIKKRWFLIVLPLLYVFIIRVILFPPRDLYTDYTAPKISNLLIPVYWQTYYWNSLVYAFTWSLSLLVGIGAVLAILLVYPWISSIFRNNTVKNDAWPVKRAIFLILYGFLLLLMGSAPYIAGGRLLTAHGYDSRYALLVGLSMSILITGIVSIITLFFRQHVEIINLCLALLFSAFIAANLDSYIGWQSKWVKDRSWMLNLQANKIAQDISVFVLSDQWLPLENERIGWYLPMDRRLDLNTMVQRTLNTDKYPVVAPVQADYTDFYKEAFFVGRYNPNGCRATLTIQRNPAASQMGQFGIVRRYWYYRFVEPNQMDAFLRGLTVVTVTRISDPAATACKS